MLQGVKRKCRTCHNESRRQKGKEETVLWQTAEQFLAANGQQCEHCSVWFCNRSKNHPNVKFCSQYCQQTDTASRRFKQWKCAKCRCQRDRGYRHCSIHRKGVSTREYRQARGDARITVGVCVQCGRRPIKAGTKRFCRYCLLYHNFKQLGRSDHIHKRQETILKRDLLTPEAATLAGVPRSTIYGRINRGTYEMVKHRLPYVKRRGSYAVQAIAAKHRKELEQEGFGGIDRERWRSESI